MKCSTRALRECGSLVPGILIAETERPTDWRKKIAGALPMGRDSKVRESVSFGRGQEHAHHIRSVFSNALIGRKGMLSTTRSAFNANLRTNGVMDGRVHVREGMWTRARSNRA